MTPPFSRPRNFDDIRSLLTRLPTEDSTAQAAAAAREPQLTKPPGSLGRLEDIASWLSGWQGRHPPTLDRPGVLVFAGNHGVTAQGVSAFPSEVTVQMVANFAAGGAAINQLSDVAGADLSVIDMDLDRPTEDFSQRPAMSERECVNAFGTGMEAVDPKWDAVALGEMGIGNTTSAAAIAHAACGRAAADWVGPGTGVADAALDRKIGVVAESVERHRAAMTDGLEILRHLGGRELAALAGAILAARFHRVPVVLDGYVTAAAAAALHAVDSTVLDHCLTGHVSAEPGHTLLLDYLGQKPLVNLGMRLGEASGAALALNVLKAAVACHTGMSTFAEAGVSDKD